MTFFHSCAQINRFFLALVLVLFSFNAPAKTVIGKVELLGFEKSVGQPRMCVKLPGPLAQDQQNYSDFLRLEGRPSSSEGPLFAQAIALTYNANELCLNELKHGYNYVVFFRNGFPLAGGDTFKPQSTSGYQFAIPDLNSEIKFQSNTLVLPTIGGPKVPLVLTNLTKFKLKVYRISEAQMQSTYGLEGLKKLDGWDIEQLEKVAHLFSEQEFSVEVAKNQPKTYNLDLTELVDKERLGIYVLVVESDQLNHRRYAVRPTQFLMFTDTGLSSYAGENGLRVYARSYNTAEPLAGTKINLVAKNQEILDTKTANQQGFVDFPLPVLKGKGGLQPVEVRAYSKNGLASYLDLTGQPLDLSDRPVGGKEPLGLFNAYLFSERGVYRPGEDIVVTGLVRNKDLQSPMQVPLTLKVINAEGEEQTETLIRSLEQGGWQYRFTVPKTAKTGQWSAHLYLDSQAEPIGSLDFGVEDYVPETLEVMLAQVEGGYTGKPLSILLNSDFLYGAPAADLKVTSAVNLVPQRRLFDDWQEYVFGHFADKTLTKNLRNTTTNDAGEALLNIPSILAQIDNPNETRTLRVVAGVQEPSGRIVRDTVSMPILNFDSWVGVRAKNEQVAFATQSNIEFNLIHINKDASVINGGNLAYRVVEEDWDYHWYYANGWRYTVNRFDKGTVTGGNLVSDAQGKVRVDLGVQPWGRYRLEVTDVSSGQSTQIRYRVGWWNASGSQSAIPDQVKMALSQPSALVGEKVAIKILPPYAGKLHLLIANDDIVEERVMDVPAQGIEVNLDIKKDFGPDVYILANVYRPGHKGAGPARAVGVSHLTIKQPQLNAQVEIIAPEKVEPNQSLNVQVKTNLPKGSRVVLAAVDEGILQLTGFNSPDPTAFFLAKRRLGLRVMDLYGHLIQHQDGESLRVRFGGDASNSGSSEQAPLSTFVRPLSIVSGLAPVDEQGNVTIALELPQFNGSVRLMAVAFNETQMGSASDSMIVRDPVVVQPLMPRFIALGDQAQVAINIHNLELPKGRFSLVWDSTENLEISDRNQMIELATDERSQMGINVTALAEDQGRIGLSVTRSDGGVQYYSWDLAVLNTRFVQEYERNVFIPSGSRGTIKSDIGDLIEQSISLNVAATNQPLLATDWLFSTLSRYPFGCLEQTTSKAWPLLLAGKGDTRLSSKEKQSRMAKVIDHIQQMQLSGGGFSLWENGRRVDQWLTMYAMEFLQEAKAQGYKVPNSMLARGMNYVENSDFKDLSVAAYAMYIRTKFGNPDAGEARYLASTLKNANDGVQSSVHLAAVFSMLGDAKTEGTILGGLKNASIFGWTRYDYGSGLRDKALFSYYVLKSPTTSQSFKNRVLMQLEGLFEDAKDKQYISTQEKAWLLRLAQLNKTAEPLDMSLPISLDFQDYELKDLGQYLKSQSTWTSAKNISDQNMYIKISTSGIAKEAARPFSNKLKITTQYTNLSSGNEVDLSQIKRGEDILVVHNIEIDADLRRDMELSIEAPLPAGFELENPRLSSGRKLLTDVDILTPSFEEYRDDRYLAAWSLTRGSASRGLEDSSFNVAYVMRAVTPGNYLVPAATIEHMYEPQLRANTSESYVIVTQD